MLVVNQPQYSIFELMKRWGFHEKASIALPMDPGPDNRYGNFNASNVSEDIRPTTDNAQLHRVDWLLDYSQHSIITTDSERFVRVSRERFECLKHAFRGDLFDIISQWKVARAGSGIGRMNSEPSANTFAPNFGMVLISFQYRATMPMGIHYQTGSVTVNSCPTIGWLKKPLVRIFEASWPEKS